jgi:hypothetical protein
MSGRKNVREMSIHALVLSIILGAISALSFAPSAQAQKIPKYKVDPSWPKELPNNWIMGNAPALAIDKNDHIWIMHRPRQVAKDDAALLDDPPGASCCTPAPSVLEFDAQGNVLKSFGGPNFVPDWPVMEHGLFIDGEGHLWIGGNYQSGGGAALTANIPKPKDPKLGDRQVLKLDQDGKVLLEIGHPSAAPMNNQDTSILGSPSEFFVDDAAHEVYIADGYLNHRVVVFDSENGTFKRGWGAYGIPLSEIDNGKGGAYDPATPSKQFRGVMSSVDISDDGMVYVGDRGGDRIQVFTKDGKFQKEFLIAPNTLGNGSVWSTMFSRDKAQKYLYVSDGENNVIHILTRADGKEVGTIGHKGREPGEFDSCERMGLDSKGNLYVTEVNHNTRIDKFVPVK